MKANELQINNFLQAPNVQFVIPVYQRNYDWATSECKQLLQDIISVEQEKRGTHFIGSIVFIHEGTYSTSEVKELVIIDGQQRLTTVNILYVALYRFAKEKDMSSDAEKLYNMFLTNQYVKNESSKLKLKQTDANFEAFKNILQGTEQQITDYSNVIENYNYFRNEINTENFELILNGLNRLIFVEVSLERGKDDPQRIFESLNSTGLDLSQSDLIRNFILMDLPPKEQQRVYESIWNPIEENAKDKLKQQSLVSNYIRDYLTLRNKKIPNKNKVYQEFKSKYTDKKSEEFQQELERMKSLSYHYRKFIDPSLETDASVRKELEYINRLEINVAYPFLLQVFEDAENGIMENKVLVEILKLIQSYAWRRFIVGLPTNALNKIFMSLYADVDTEDYYNSIAIALLRKKGRAKFPNDDEVKGALKDKDLYNTQPKNRSYLFELLENYNNREYVDTSNEQITIEHIFPQNPAEEWSADVSQAEYLLFKEKHLNTIGNLTLSGNNGALSNKSFSEKKEMNNEGKEEGYKFSRLWLNDYLRKIDYWRIANFNERFELIYNRFLNIWQYPDVELTEIDETEEQNIFDIDEATYKKIDYFVFGDTRIDNEESVAQLYFFVLNRLHEINSKLLITNEGILKITRSAADFRAPQDLDNGWYIETNIDNNSKFSIMKKLLRLYNLEEELSIKFQASEEKGKLRNRHIVRLKYWEQLLSKLDDTELFNNVSTSKSHWLSTGAGIAGLSFTMIIVKSYSGLELTISGSSKETNIKYFRKLFAHKEEIEKAFGEELDWEELPDNKMSRIRFDQKGLNIFNESRWEEINTFFTHYLPKFVEAFKPFIKKIK